jgi:hypothetical protein
MVNTKIRAAQSICFEAKVEKIDQTTLVRLPESASAKLPSRGMVMGEGTINGVPLQLPLEPDGKGGHWYKLEKDVQKSADAAIGDALKVELVPTVHWPEPNVPDDVQNALANDAEARKIWDDITPMARWEWLRWIRGTNNPDTYHRHITVALSKMKSAHRRPCCFNRNACSDPAVSKNGVLLEAD